MLEALIFVVFPFCMVFAAVSDMLSMTIANRVSVLLVATFAVVAPLTGMDWAVYGWHFAAGGAGACSSPSACLRSAAWAAATPSCWPPLRSGWASASS